MWVCLFFKDPPSVKMKTDPVYVNIGDTADLLCIADANPVTDGMFSWKWMVRHFHIYYLQCLLLTAFSSVYVLFNVQKSFFKVQTFYLPVLLFLNIHLHASQYRASVCQTMSTS